MILTHTKDFAKKDVTKKCAPLDFSLYTWELNLGQTISIKWRCHWEHLREPFGKLDGNTWGTRGKNYKSLSTHDWKRKNQGPPWLHEISLSKTAGHHFPPGQILPKQKMVRNSCGKRDFMQPMGRLNMHSRGVFFVFLRCSISARAISPGEKRRPTVLETKNTRRQWVGWIMH